MSSLSIEEALKVSESFLITLYSYDVYKRWTELKYRMNFTTEKQFVSWIMDCVEQQESDETQEDNIDDLSYDEEVVEERNTSSFTSSHDQEHQQIVAYQRHSSNVTETVVEAVTPVGSRGDVRKRPYSQVTPGKQFEKRMEVAEAGHGPTSSDTGSRVKCELRPTWSDNTVGKVSNVSGSRSSSSSVVVQTPRTIKQEHAGGEVITSATGGSKSIIQQSHENDDDEPGADSDMSCINTSSGNLVRNYSDDDWFIPESKAICTSLDQHLETPRNLSDVADGAGGCKHDNNSSNLLSGLDETQNLPGMMLKSQNITRMLKIGTRNVPSSQSDDITADKSCVHCGRTFFNHSSMKRHINDVHLRIKTHKCMYCYLSFSQKCTLNLHLAKIHKLF